MFYLFNLLFNLTDCRTLLSKCFPCFIALYESVKVLSEFWQNFYTFQESFSLEIKEHCFAYFANWFSFRHVFKAILLLLVIIQRRNLLKPIIRAQRPLLSLQRTWLLVWIAPGLRALVSIFAFGTPCPRVTAIILDLLSLLKSWLEMIRLVRLHRQILVRRSSVEHNLLLATVVLACS